MHFVMPDLSIEALLRDGLADIRQNPEVLDRLFSFLNNELTHSKFGQAEILKIKSVFSKKDIKVVHSFSEALMKSPCYSIQLASDSEAKGESVLDDYKDTQTEFITDPDDLANLIVLDTIMATSYDSVTGKVVLDSGTNLANINQNMIFQDASDNEFSIIGPLSNETGDKFLFLDVGLTLDVGDFCLIKSSINFNVYEESSVQSNVNVIVGVHTKDALLTKYLYILLKYIIVSRKKHLEQYGCIYNISFSGSDFTRNMEMAADMVFTRFMTITGTVDDSWRSDDIPQIENVEIELFVEQDTASDSDLELQNQIIKPQ